MYNNEKNTKYVSRSQVIHLFIFRQKTCETRISFNDKGILDQISIALCFIVFAPQVERAFGKANVKF